MGSLDLSSADSESDECGLYDDGDYGVMTPPIGSDGGNGCLLPRRCGCELRRPLICTCWTSPNKGRRFVTCRRQKVGGCGLGKWLDPMFPAQARAVINELHEDKSGVISVRDELGRQLCEKGRELKIVQQMLEKAKAHHEYLQDQDQKQLEDLHTCLVEKKMMKKRMKWLGVLNVALGIVIVSVVNALYFHVVKEQCTRRMCFVWKTIVKD